MTLQAVTASNVPCAATVQVENIHKSFGTHRVLKGISFTARKGEVLCIIGASGSSKSTLLRCINHLVVPDKGEVHIGTDILRTRTQRNGTPTSQDPRLLERVRCRLGMVFQNFNLRSPRTAVQNITEGPVHVLRQPRAQAPQPALELLAKVGLEY